MKNTTKAFVFWLPLMVVITVVGWTVFGALPGAQMTGDLIAWLLELPVTTCYALAAVASAALFKRVFWREVDCDEEAELNRLAQAGNRQARWLIIKDRAEWLCLLILSGIYFFPHY